MKHELIYIFHILGQGFLYIRPSDQFELSDAPVDWRCIDLKDADDDALFDWLCATAQQTTTVKYLILWCKRKSDPTKIFHIKVRGKKLNVLYEDTERLDFDDSHIYSVMLIPCVRLKNLLPYPILFSYDPVELEITKLESGEEKQLPYAIFGKSCMCHWCASNLF